MSKENVAFNETIITLENTIFDLESSNTRMRVKLQVIEALFKFYVEGLGGQPIENPYIRSIGRELGVD